MFSIKKIFSYIYSFIPLKRLLFEFIKQFYKPKKQIYQHLHFKGLINLEVNKNNKFIMYHYGYQLENEVFWNGLFGGWEKYSLQLWSRLCEHSTIIFDIGANTGIYSLLAKTIKPSSEIYAFEPVERVFNKLKHNVNLNRYDVHCVKKAVSNYDGKATIYDTNSEHLYSVTVNQNTSSTPDLTTPCEIETITLDTFIDDQNIKNIDLMKIDVEMHEVEVLEGFEKYLNLYQPSLIIEILNDEMAKKIQTKISNINYLYFNIDENTGIRQVENLTKSDYYNFLICTKEVASLLKLI